MTMERNRFREHDVQKVQPNEMNQEAKIEVLVQSLVSLPQLLLELSSQDGRNVEQSIFVLQKRQFVSAIVQLLAVPTP